MYYFNHSGHAGHGMIKTVINNLRPIDTNFEDGKSTHDDSTIDDEAG